MEWEAEPKRKFEVCKAQRAHSSTAESCLRGNGQGELLTVKRIAKGMDGGRLPITVIVCALNEELNLPECLDSVAWAAQLLVVDAGSEDATLTIANVSGAEVVVHPWSGYSDQKNWALENLPIDNDWVLFLDADERVPRELAEEISAIVRDRDGRYAGYYVARRLIFMGRWLKHSYWYPDYTLRLFKRRAGRFESRLVHERVILDGQVGYLVHDLVHDDQRDIATYISRLNRYSSLEAYEMFRVRIERRRSEIQPDWRGSWAQRRRALKENVWYRLPLRPLLRFVWTMGPRRGVLDGREGLIFTVLACINEWQADAKFYELKRNRRRGQLGPPPMIDISPGRRMTPAGDPTASSPPGDGKIEHH